MPDRRRLLAALPLVAIIVFDENFHISTFNPAAEHMFGRSARELRGRALSGLLPPAATRGAMAGGSGVGDT